ncbi:hypothetical protein M422DRAFT_255084 [Sphaerobolus stellatus SS14]|uniref:Uncharacterized protein n=1 Tax=Sphaerobolus stellatus (strain SS14) TaxID=990650 RepID=A0A0C9UFH5_SPHS4|nr:hypothetical protein M422DRAFT_255084 [Sphaerobolus stellatus SS14]
MSCGSSIEVIERICSKSSCTITLPPVKEHKWKTCRKHREDSWLRKENECQESTNNVHVPHQPHTDIQVSAINSDIPRPSKCLRTEGMENQGNGEDTSTSATEMSRKKRVKKMQLLRFDSTRGLFNSMKAIFKQDASVEYYGSYEIPIDPIYLTEIA